MSFETTRLPLPQELIPICTSYLTPPESTYIATHQPADQTATALFAQFRAAYNSQAMWDHLAPSHGIDAGPGSRAAVTAHYQALNTRVLTCLNAERPLQTPELPMPEGDPFVANARLQGLVIRCLINSGRTLFHPLERSVVAMALHTAFSPMRAVVEGEEVVSEDFYGASPGYVFSSIEAYQDIVHGQLNGFLGACLIQHGPSLFREYGGKLTTQTLMTTIAQLLDLSNEVGGDIVQKHLDLIKLHMNIDTIQKDLNFFDLLNQMMEHRSNEITCQFIKFLRDEMILRGLKIPEGPRQGQAFDDHYLLACAQDKKNEAVIFMVQELIRKLKSMPSERPTAEGAGAAAGAGAGAAAAAGK